MKQFTVIQRIEQELVWEVEAEDNLDAEHKTLHCGKEPDFVNIVESEVTVTADEE